MQPDVFIVFGVFIAEDVVGSRDGGEPGSLILLTNMTCLTFRLLWE